MQDIYIYPKIFPSTCVQKIDKYTIENEPIRSIDLMERASLAIFNKIKERFNIEKTAFAFFIGPGNNGGDGLAVARMLLENKSKVKVYVLKSPEKLSDDSKINYDRLLKTDGADVIILEDLQRFPKLTNEVIVDAIFGSGLKRPVMGFLGDIIKKINSTVNYVVSIDIPSGLFGEDNSDNTDTIINADFTITLQFPFLSMMFAENEKYAGKFEIIDIGLHTDAIQNTATDYYLVSKEYCAENFKTRKRFSHKGSFGHALLVCGSKGKAGAGILSLKSCLKTGAGLVTAHVPSSLWEIIQTSIPEAMLSIDTSKFFFSEVENIEPYNAIGIGPGLGTDEVSETGMIELLKKAKANIVIDADGLNILSAYDDFKDLLPPNTILTPHPKEFERLFGKHSNTFEVVKTMIDFSVTNKIIIIYKSGISIISTPDGKVFFNTNGNPGMATAGSGDVLTGIITGLLAQKYSPENAAIMGVYLHSVAGDFAKQKLGEECMIAGDITDNLHLAFNTIR